jgi:hypothetical protein
MNEQSVVIVGAGGKMGARAAQKIGNQPGFRVVMCEANVEKARTLEQQGFQVTPLVEALANADFAVLAVPDALIGRIASDAVPKMKPGGTLIMLDAAAAYIGELPHRDGITQMIAHPCHPAMFAEQATPEARRDRFGGIATQDILVALIEGSRENFERGVTLAKAIFAPTDKAHEVTAEQFALLEPAMSEMIVATAARLMRDSLDAAIEKGVPREAAEAFMAGHAQIAIAICFGAEPSPFSDAAQMAIQWGMREIVSPDWKKAFEPEVLRDAIRYMLHSAQVERGIADGR